MYEYNTKRTEQTEQARADQVENSAGGFVFAVDKWTRFDRFLILGCEGGTYYVKAPEITKDNALNVMACVEAEGARAIERIVEISDSGRAPKNEPALFALALATTSSNPVTRKFAWSVLSQVARIGTHLFHFAQYRQNLAGWGRLARKGIAGWYAEQGPSGLAMQLLKYRQRDGWTHRDLLRLSHPKAGDALTKAIFDVTCRPDTLEAALPLLPPLYTAYHLAQTGKYLEAIEAGAVREFLPPEALKQPDVWSSMLPKMPATALLRNLGNMTRLDVIKPLSPESKMVATRLADPVFPRKARIHPYSALVALKTYGSGGTTGLAFARRQSEPYQPVPQVVDALEQLVEHAFSSVEPTGKRYMIAIDVSGSMNSAVVEGGLACSEAAAAIALAVARSEQDYFILGFADGIRDLGITAKSSFQDAARKTHGFTGGGTDCSLPMIYALQHKLMVDTFMVITDNETWAGRMHPFQALQEYRRKMNPKAKLAVLGMTATNFSIADPSDAGMLDLIGMDANVPRLIADFSGD